MGVQTFKLTEDAVQEMTSVLTNMTSNVNMQLGSLRNRLELLCEQTRYEPAVTVVNGFIQYFMVDETRKRVTEKLEDWRTSKASCLEMTRELKAGEKAEEFAKQTDNNLIKIVEDFWEENQLGDPIDNINTSEPDVDVEQMMEFTDIYMKAREAIDDECKKSKTQVNTLAAANVTLTPLASIVNILAECISAAMDGMIDTFKSVTQGFSESKAEAASKATDYATSVAAAKVDPGFIGELDKCSGLV